MHDPIEQFEHAGYLIKIYVDDDPGDYCNPRKWENLGTMYCWHREYELGDERVDTLGYRNLAEVIETLPAHPEYAILPLYLYDHSGISISTSNERYPFDCKWDTSLVGVIIMTYDKIQEMQPDTDDKVREALRREVEIYNSYLMGEIYGYVIENKFGKQQDACWGFVGDIEDCKETAKSMADYYRTEADNYSDELRSLDRIVEDEIAQGIETEFHGFSEVVN